MKRDWNRGKPTTITFKPAPYIREKLEALVDSREFNNISQLINTALTEWLKDREHEEEKERIAEGEAKLG